jgi:predicted amidohydrolase
VLRLHALSQAGARLPRLRERRGQFGVVICSGGGYVEPSRILALKGARVIFSPHFNYIGKEGLIGHFMQARADHVARAVENGVYFVRGNNVVLGKDPPSPLAIARAFV